MKTNSNIPLAASKVSAFGPSNMEAVNRGVYVVSAKEATGKIKDTRDMNHVKNRQVSFIAITPF